jgi:hypothetical protein
MPPAQTSRRRHLQNRRRQKIFSSLSISGGRERLKATVEGYAMRYMCLVYLDEEKMVAFAKDPGAIGAFEKEVVAYDQELNDKGVLVMASPLKRVREAVTIRVRDGRMSATDGPFAETKEQLGGFTLIDVRDLNEAIALAECSPLARIGSIEVRPVGHPGWPESTA